MISLATYSKLAFLERTIFFLINALIVIKSNKKSVNILNQKPNLID